MHKLGLFILYHKVVRLLISKTKVYGKILKIPKKKLIFTFWNYKSSHKPFQNQEVKSVPFMARYSEDLETPVKSVTSVTLYCFV